MVPDKRDPADRPLSWPSQRKSTGHGVLRDRRVAADDEVLVEARDRGQPALDRPRRQPALTVFDANYPVPESRFPLGLDEREDVSCDDLTWVLVDDAEEHLEVEGHCKQRVCSSASAHQVQVDIEQRMPEPDQVTAARTGSTQKARNERHDRSPIDAVTRPARPPRPPSGSPAYLNQWT